MFPTTKKKKKKKPSFFGMLLVIMQIRVMSRREYKKHGLASSPQPTIIWRRRRIWRKPWDHVKWRGHYTVNDSVPRTRTGRRSSRGPLSTIVFMTATIECSAILCLLSIRRDRESWRSVLSWSGVFHKKKW